MASPATPTTEAEPRGDEAERFVGGGDPIEAAIGIAGTGSFAELCGRLTSEGAGPVPNPPDADDPAALGGVRRRPRTGDDRPPGGLSPMGPREQKESANWLFRGLISA